MRILTTQLGYSCASTFKAKGPTARKIADFILNDVLRLSIMDELIRCWFGLMRRGDRRWNAPRIVGVFGRERMGRWKVEVGGRMGKGREDGKGAGCFGALLTGGNWGQVSVTWGNQDFLGNLEVLKLERRLSGTKAGAQEGHLSCPFVFHGQQGPGRKGYYYGTTTTTLLYV